MSAPYWDSKSGLSQECKSISPLRHGSKGPHSQSKEKALASDGEASPFPWKGLGCPLFTRERYQRFSWPSTGNMKCSPAWSKPHVQHTQMVKECSTKREKYQWGWGRNFWQEFSKIKGEKPERACLRSLSILYIKAKYNNNKITLF